MAKTARRTRTVGITHHPLDAERGNQKRVPPRGEAKEKKKTRTRADSSRSERETGTIARRGAKGGKTGGSRAGLVSRNKKSDRR